MAEKRFKFLKEHYDTIKDFAYIGMVLWFVPFLSAVYNFRNDIVCYVCISMFLLHFASVMCFDDDRLWRWIND